MKNRAKCKLCNSIIESLTLLDYVSCECGEISISGGTKELNCFAKDFGNFIRVDDEGREHQVKVIDKANDHKEVPLDEEEKRELTREEKVEFVDNMLKYYEELPAHAMMSSPSQYDLKAIVLLIKQVL